MNSRGRSVVAVFLSETEVQTIPLKLYPRVLFRIRVCLRYVVASKYHYVLFRYSPYTFFSDPSIKRFIPGWTIGSRLSRREVMVTANIDIKRLHYLGDERNLWIIPCPMWLLDASLPISYSFVYNIILSLSIIFTMLSFSSPSGIVQVSVDCAIVISPRKQSLTYKQCGFDGLSVWLWSVRVSIVSFWSLYDLPIQFPSTTTSQNRNGCGIRDWIEIMKIFWKDKINGRIATRGTICRESDYSRERFSRRKCNIMNIFLREYYERRYSSFEMATWNIKLMGFWDFITF